MKHRVLQDYGRRSRSSSHAPCLAFRISIYFHFPISNPLKMKSSTIVLAILLMASALSAQDATDQVMYKAYLRDQPAPDVWKSAIATRKEELKRAPRDRQRQFQVALAQFGLLSSTMRKRDEDLFDAYYDETEDLLKSITDEDKKWGEPMALLSAVYGLKMGYSPMQGIFLGSKSSSLVEKAKKLSPTSPLVWKVAANAKFFTPEMWGGDLAEAIEGYEACIKHYEAQSETLKFNWMYLDALAFMGQAYVKNGENGKAITAYEKALRQEPEFGWVKFVLLPKAKGASTN